MKVIFLALALGTATAALPAASNTFLTEHEINTTIYSVVPQAMMAVVGAILLGIHRGTFDKVSKSLGKLKRLNEFESKLQQGTCCTCQEENIRVVHSHDLKDNSKADHAMCVPCLKKYHKSSGEPLNMWGQHVKFCCPMCRGGFDNPVVQEALKFEW